MPQDVSSVAVPFPTRADLALMEGYHSPQVNCSVRLNTNESPFPAPAGWQEALSDSVASLDFRRYPDRSASALCGGLAGFHGVEPCNVFAANGSNEVLQTICLTYGGAGRTVLVFEPTYAMHSHIARVSGSTVVTVNRAENLTLDIATVLAAIDEVKPAIIFLCSPNNPTGLIEPRALVESVVAHATGIVVVDEAYGQFADWSAQELLSESATLCVVRTYSKTWAMAAARLGYLLAPKWMIADFEKTVLPYHLDSVKQIAGLLALRYAEDMRARVGELTKERERIISALHGLAVEVWPSQANFVLFRPHGVTADDAWQLMVDQSVLVRNCASWPGLAGCLRVTVGTPDENNAFLAALQVALQGPGQ